MEANETNDDLELGSPEEGKDTEKTEYVSASEYEADLRDSLNFTMEAIDWMEKLDTQSVLMLTHGIGQDMEAAMVKLYKRLMRDINELCPDEAPEDPEE